MIVARLREAAARLRKAASAPGAERPLTFDDIDAIRAIHPPFIVIDGLVATTIADWMDYTASIVTDDNDEARDDGCDCPYCIGIPKALAVADAILGSES